MRAVWLIVSVALSYAAALTLVVCAVRAISPMLPKDDIWVHVVAAVPIGLVCGLIPIGAFELGKRIERAGRS